MNIEIARQEVSGLLQASESLSGRHCDLSFDIGDTLDEQSSIAVSESRENLGLWIATLELSIQWLAHFHDLLSHSASSNHSERLVVPYSILGASIAQAVSIRKLCLSGLDTPARSLLRTLFESIDLAILTFFDFEAQDAFLCIAESEEARGFWNKYVRRKKNSETGRRTSRVDEVLTEVLASSGHDLDHISALMSQHNGEIDYANRTVHLSLYGAQFTTKLLSSDSERLLPGRFGNSTLFSVRTLSQASKWIWLFSRIVHPLLVKHIEDGSEGLYTLDLSTHIADQEAVAYQALNAMVVTHWDDDKAGNTLGSDKTA